MRGSCANGKKDLVQKIYELYPQSNRGEDLFVKLAEFRSKNAVEFLYRNGHNDTLLVIKTFVEAARFGNTVVVEFLLDTKRIVSDIFDKAFEYAASGYRNSPTAIFLYHKKLASKNSVIGVFEQAHDISVVKLLFENEDVPVKSAIVAFDNASYCGRGSNFEVFAQVRVYFRSLDWKSVCQCHYQQANRRSGVFVP
ncbi:hypothetical protein JG688_00013409 [Phytophthora aleatoria]|uniref:Uncharacterized protein n=1 Tax=Phytophthora aleatoria TaxID=2496075 RepID=A0A8J5J1Q5_9STRA|nr:hypothetical protein JG688_00013409 [Phytophthora aleatoria]